MKILVSNDDGIYSRGIKVLVNGLLKKGHDVYVVAPLEEQSGTGHGITLHTPLRVAEVFRDGSFFGYSVNGKPADCVKIACSHLYGEIKFDYVVTGINRGENLGIDLFYSGTYSAAAEASLYGYKSIAISIAISSAKDYYYETAAKFLADYLDKIEDVKFPKHGLLNINVPNVTYEKIKGHRYTKQSGRRVLEEIIERKDGLGNSYFWLGGTIEEINNSKKDDFLALKDNYISVTPTKLDYNDEDFYKELMKKEK